MRKIISPYCQDIKESFILIKKVNIKENNIIWYICKVNDIEDNMYLVDSLYILTEDIPNDNIKKEDINPIFWDKMNIFELIHQPQDNDKIYIVDNQETFIISQDEYNKFKDRFIKLDKHSVKDFKVVQNIV